MKEHIIIKALKNTKKYIVMVPILSMIISYLTLQIPIYLKYAIDGIVYKDTQSIPQYITRFFNENWMYNLIIIILFLILTIVMNGAITYIRDRISCLFNLKVNKNLKMEIFRHIENLEYQSYYNYDKDEMLQRIKDDANTYSNFFNTSLNLILDTFFILIFVIKESLELNRIITIYILISVMVLIIFAIWYFKKLDIRLQEMIKARKGLLSKTITSIRNFKLIRILNKQKEEINDYNKLNKKYTNSCIEFVNLVLFHEIITDHISCLAEPIIFILGGILVINGQLTLGTLTVLVSFAQKIMEYFISVGNNLDDIDNFIVVNKLLNKLINLEEEKEYPKLIELNGDILFINVTIKVEDNIILKDINLQIRKGEKIAIIGENGSGKSILAKTLLGYYDYTGNIYIGNINLKRISKKQIREYISLVTEEPFIFSGTIYDNICLYKDIEKKKLDEATKTANIYDEIQKFRNNYQAVVGERGITLSGGQKQRIALSRTLLQEKQTLILDEAINKVDERTKAKLLENVIINNKNTVIIITHDLKILEKIDKIIFLHGTTSYVGTHKELLRNKDYKNMITINEDII